MKIQKLSFTNAGIAELLTKLNRPTKLQYLTVREYISQQKQ